MKKLKLFRMFLIFSGCYLLSCSKKSEDQVQPPPPACDASAATYTQIVLPIISVNCYGCHGNGRTDGGINLDGYTNLKVKADNGELIGVITHAAGFPAMPFNKPKLSDCDIKKITSWVTAGAPNN